MRRILLIGSLNSLPISVDAQDVALSVPHKFSISAGYIGGFDNLTEEEDKLNGFFINGSIKANSKIGFYAEYTNQKMSVLKFDEVHTGIQYKFYDNKKINGSFGAGVGYMWLDQSLHAPDLNLRADLSLNYITMPLFVEGEVKLSEHISYFGKLSYTWLFNYDSQVCLSSNDIQTMCDNINEDSNGLMYKLGMRYSF